MVNRVLAFAAAAAVPVCFLQGCNSKEETKPAEEPKKTDKKDDAQTPPEKTTPEISESSSLESILQNKKTKEAIQATMTKLTNDKTLSFVDGHLFQKNPTETVAYAYINNAAEQKGKFVTAFDEECFTDQTFEDQMIWYEYDGDKSKVDNSVVPPASVFDSMVSEFADISDENTYVVRPKDYTNSDVENLISAVWMKNLKYNAAPEKQGLEKGGVQSQSMIPAVVLAWLTPKSAPYQKMRNAVMVVASPVDTQDLSQIFDAAKRMFMLIRESIAEAATWEAGKLNNANKSNEQKYNQMSAAKKGNAGLYNSWYRYRKTTKNGNDVYEQIDECGAPRPSKSASDVLDPETLQQDFIKIHESIQRAVTAYDTAFEAHIIGGVQDHNGSETAFVPAAAAVNGAAPVPAHFSTTNYGSPALDGIQGCADIQSDATFPTYPEYILQKDQAQWVDSLKTFLRKELVQQSRQLGQCIVQQLLDDGHGLDAQGVFVPTTVNGVQTDAAPFATAAREVYTSMKKVSQDWNKKDKFLHNKGTAPSVPAVAAEERDFVPFAVKKMLVKVIAMPRQSTKAKYHQFFPQFHNKAQWSLDTKDMFYPKIEDPASKFLASTRIHTVQLTATSKNQDRLIAELAGAFDALNENKQSFKFFLGRKMSASDRKNNSNDDRRFAIEFDGVEKKDSQISKLILNSKNDGYKTAFDSLKELVKKQ